MCSLGSLFVNDGFEQSLGYLELFEVLGVFVGVPTGDDGKLSGIVQQKISLGHVAVEPAVNTVPEVLRGRRPRSSWAQSVTVRSPVVQGEARVVVVRTEGVRLGTMLCSPG